MPKIGIDFGTTNSYVAASIGGKVTVIENEYGKRATPSCVSYVEDEIVIGERAAQNVVSDWKNTTSGFKRVIGRRFDDHAVSKFVQGRCFGAQKDGKSFILQSLEGDGTKFSAEEAAARLLNRMKEIAESKLEGSVTGVVITVPASFNVAQREAIKKIAKLLKLPEVRLVNETTAVAVGYAAKLAKDGPTHVENLHHVLIFHVGAGSTEATVARVTGKTVDVLSHAGINNLGGTDLDDNVMEYWIRRQRRKRHLGENVNGQTMAKIRKACESAKRHLSLLPEVKVSVYSPLDDRDYQENVTRKNFETINHDLLSLILGMTDLALAKAKIPLERIEDVILVGGQTRILEHLPTFSQNPNIPNSKRYRRLNEDEAAVIGAAMLADENNAFTVNDIDEPQMTISLGRGEMEPPSSQEEEIDGRLRQMHRLCQTKQLCFEMILASNQDTYHQTNQEDLTAETNGHEATDFAQEGQQITIEVIPSPWDNRKDIGRDHSETERKHHRRQMDKDDVDVQLPENRQASFSLQSLVVSERASLLKHEENFDAQLSQNQTANFGHEPLDVLERECPIRQEHHRRQVVKVNVNVQVFKDLLEKFTLKLSTILESECLVLFESELISTSKSTFRSSRQKKNEVLRRSQDRKRRLIQHLLKIVIRVRECSKEIYPQGCHPIRNQVEDFVYDIWTMIDREHPKSQRTVKKCRDILQQKPDFTTQEGRLQGIAKKEKTKLQKAQTGLTFTEESDTVVQKWTSTEKFVRELVNLCNEVRSKISEGKIKHLAQLQEMFEGLRKAIFETFLDTVYLGTPGEPETKSSPAQILKDFQKLLEDLDEMSKENLIQQCYEACPALTQNRDTGAQSTKTQTPRGDSMPEMKFNPAPRTRAAPNCTRICCCWPCC